MHCTIMQLFLHLPLFPPDEKWIKIPLVNPTFWLNHIFFTTPYHWKNNTVREQFKA